MGLRGQAAVAIWHDIAPEGRAEFYRWHGNEHMDERLAIPGFLRGRRYVAETADLEFFNLYEAESLAVLKGDGYTTRLNDPTPWTVSTVAHFRAVSRSLCAVVNSTGAGGGGLVVTVRYDAQDGGEDGLWRTVLSPLAGEDGVAGVHLLVADTAASSVSTAESEARGQANAVPTRAVLVEGWGDAGPLADLCTARLGDDVLRRHGARGPIGRGLYRLQLCKERPGASAGSG